jgi:mRNA interferase HicA
VTANELKRKLAALGCKFEDGRKHTIVLYNNRAVTMPRHPAKEIKNGTYRGILKQLGIKEE